MGEHLAMGTIITVEGEEDGEGTRGMGVGTTMVGGTGTRVMPHQGPHAAAVVLLERSEEA
jgi:hypothetical protein